MMMFFLWFCLSNKCVVVAFKYNVVVKDSSDAKTHPFLGVWDDRQNDHDWATQVYWRWNSLSYPKEQLRSMS